MEALRNFETLFLKPAPQKTLQQFTDEFLVYAKSNFAHRTWLIYSGALKKFIEIEGNPTLRNLSPQHLDHFKAERLSKKKSPVTVNIELRTLRAAMNTAVRWKLLDINPFAKINQVRLPEALPSYFTKEDFYRLLGMIKEEWLKDIVVFAALTGMRRGEILNLRWQDVHLQRRMIHIHTSPSFKTKQGRQRVVPMNDVVLNLLSVKASRFSSEYVFHKKGRKILEDHASKKLKQYVIASGINAELHFHSLRHTFASWLVQDGVSLYEVQKLLGHSNISVTQVYSHLKPEQLHSTVNRLSLPLN
jgi:integrase